MAIAERTHVMEMYKTIRQSYCYENLSLKDFNEILDYLSGRHVSLEDRHIYAKICTTKKLA